MKNVFVFVFALGILSGYSQGFTPVTSGSVVHDGGWNYSCCWADFNNDGFDDLFVCNNDANNGKLNFLYYNNGDGTFTRDESGGPVTTDGGSSYGCCAADYDNDGYIDLFVANYNENNFLYRNTSSGFIRITGDPVVTGSGKSTGCEWIDYDRDGYLDLFVCNRDQVNYLFHNQGDGTFIRIYAGILTSEVKNTGACTWGDFDQNGSPDEYLANSGPVTNTLVFNNGDGTFTQITGDPAVSDIDNFDMACNGDIDNDGDPDLYTAAGMLPGGPYMPYLYQNQGDGTFIRIPDIPHAGINSGGGCSMIDFDNDGDLDIFHTAYDGNNLVLENDGNGLFTQVVTGALATDGNYNKEASWSDLDNDGDLDVFIAVNNYFGGNNKLFLNNGNANNWLSIICEGTISNRNGIGAMISVTTDASGTPLVQRFRVDDLNSLTNHSGLGSADIIDELKVEWPSGIVTIETEVTGGQKVIIPETAVGLPSAESGTNDILLVTPNPFTHTATICLTSPLNDQPTSIIEIRTLTGIPVATIHLSEHTSGWIWDGTDYTGQPVPPGMYIGILLRNDIAITSAKLIRQ